MLAANSSQQHLRFRFDFEEMALFEQWNVSSNNGFFLSIAFVFTMGVLNEFLNFHIKNSSKQQKGIANQPRASERIPLLHHQKTGARNRRYLGINEIMVAVSMKILQITLSYWLMSVVMTYNVWLTSAVIVGAGVGNFLTNIYLFDG